MIKAFLILVSAISFSIFAQAESKPAPATKASGKVFFVEPKDGATVSPKFTVKFGVEGIKIRPAGEDVKDQSSGHHHLIINGGPLKEKMVIPADATHMHFGKGQTETSLDLKPGDYTLTLQFADGAHMSYGEGLSSSIKIKVK